MILCIAGLIGFSVHGLTYLSIPKNDHSGFDYDMTQYSKDMRYALTANIMNHSDEYIGKTIRAEGTFYSYPDGKDSWRYAVFISDTMGCCSAGIPMIMQTDFQRPQNGSAIIVSGTLVYVVYAGKQQISLQNVDLTVK
jgi:hypothetical protein